MTNRTIWKFPIDGEQLTQRIPLPVGAGILTVQMQNGNVCLWAMVDPAAPIQPRTIEIIGTGWDLISFEDRKYIATIQIHELVFHIFERTDL